MAFCPQPKSRPHLLTKQARALDLARVERVENAKIRKRSGGRCESIHRFSRFVGVVSADLRCARRAVPGSHHLIGGSGRRNVGRSILAAHRLAVCADCHREITGHVLQPIGTQAVRECAATVVYERIGKVTT